ncbi:MAG: tetratricopeptide repeat protein [Hyphomicrobiaceae bacterium]
MTILVRMPRSGLSNVGAMLVAVLSSVVAPRDALAWHEHSHSVDDVTNARILCISEAAAQRFAAALQACDLAFQSEPDRAEILSNRGVARLMLGDAARAVQDFSAAIDRAPGHPLHYYNRALVEEQLGEWRAALADYSTAITRAPGMAIAFNNRGLAFERLGDQTAAKADYARATELDPGLKAAAQNLARLSR